MFEKLKELFSKTEEEREFKQLNYSEARSFFVENTQEQLSNTYTEFIDSQKKITAALNELELMLKELGETSAEEEKAKGSQNVKNAFVERALQSITDISNNNRTFDEIKMFLEDVSAATEQINGITPKQAMHLGFFFREQMSKITGKSKDVQNGVDELNEKFRTGFMKKREKIHNIFREIDELISKKSVKNEELEKIPEEMSNIKNMKIQEMGEKDKIDSNEMMAAQSHLAAMTKERTDIKKEIAARLSTIERMLRKYAHKDIAAKEYATDAMKELLNDEERKIVDILRKAIDSYELGFEEKEKTAARVFIREYSNTSGKVKQLKKLNDDIKKKKHYINTVYKPKQAELDRIDSTVADYEKKIEEKETEKAHLQLEMQSIDKKIKERKADLAKLLGSVLDKEIVVR